MRKRCTVCGLPKPRKEFYNNKRSFHDGTVYYDQRPDCKTCTKARENKRYHKRVRAAKRAKGK